MATSLPTPPSSSSTTVVDGEIPSLAAEEQVSSGVVRLKLHKPCNKKKVSWTNDTVDNEHLGRKKSKCCCVYVKPHDMDVTSSESDDGECEHCMGHVEKKKKKKKSNNNNNDNNNTNQSQPGTHMEK